MACVSVFGQGRVPALQTRMEGIVTMTAPFTQTLKFRGLVWPAHSVMRLIISAAIFFYIFGEWRGITIFTQGLGFELNPNYSGLVVNCAKKALRTNSPSQLPLELFVDIEED